MCKVLKPVPLYLSSKFDEFFFGNLTPRLKYDTPKKKIVLIKNWFLFQKKPWGHVETFFDIWGQISKFVKSSQIITQNESLDIGFAKICFRVTQGHPGLKILKKGHIAICIMSSKATHQNDAFDVCCMNFRFRVIQGHSNVK